MKIIFNMKIHVKKKIYIFTEEKKNIFQAPARKSTVHTENHTQKSINFMRTKNEQPKHHSTHKIPSDEIQSKKNIQKSNVRSKSTLLTTNGILFHRLLWLKNIPNTQRTKREKKKLRLKRTKKLCVSTCSRSGGIRRSISCALSKKEERKNGFTVSCVFQSVSARHIYRR